MARKTDSSIRFSATLLSPKRSSPRAKPVSWTFLIVPKRASAKLPSRGQTIVEGTLNDAPILATLEPDGEGSHWLKVDAGMRKAAGAEAGDDVALEIAPVPPDREPEPKTPADLRKALAGADPEARAAWKDITPRARRDWIHWITSGKRAETRTIRIDKACDMLANGKRRPCCFDRSGIYGGNLSRPEAEDPRR